MKLAIFGGTGFLGYDFVQLVESRPDIELTVFSTSAKSLVNLARHDLELKLVEPENFQELTLDADTDFVINFSHPFSIRNDLTPRKQLELFVSFLARQKRSIPSLRLVHLSTMSVYEPFGHGIHYAESQELRPPRSDDYARDKVFVETALKKLPAAGQWQLHLRPTIVYGPFCRPWTDRIMQAFNDGNVYFRDLSGMIQPVYGHDVSRFISDVLEDFQPGTYNFAGDAEMSWQQFLAGFEALSGGGSLRLDAGARPSEYGPSVSTWSLVKESSRDLLSNIAADDSFVRMAQPFVRTMPRRFVVWVRDKVFGGTSNIAVPPTARSIFASDFFRENRLLDRSSFLRDFPGFRFSAMQDNNEELRRYFEFRFSDKPLQ